jgi:hypothetical protein
MARRVVPAVLAAVMISGCDDDTGFKGCAGAAVIVSADGAASCLGRCIEYLDTLSAAIESATPSSCTVETFNGRSLGCLPIASAGGCEATPEEAGALQVQISDYLSASWPELGSPTLSTCACHVD